VYKRQILASIGAGPLFVRGGDALTMGAAEIRPGEPPFLSKSL